jgi:hypothetical protein
VPRVYACHRACPAEWVRQVVLALLDGQHLKSHRVGLAYQPIRGCFLQVVWVRRVFRFVWVHRDVRAPLGVGVLRFQDVGGHQHRLYGEERVCRRVRVAASDVRGCRFWSERPRVVGSQDGVEPQRGKRFAASGPGVHLVGLVLPRGAGLAGMARVVAWMLGGRLMPPQGC